MSRPLHDLMVPRPRHSDTKPVTFRIMSTPTVPFDRESRAAADRHTLQQWDDLVTAHRGEVQERAVVWIDGERHEHEGYVIARDYSLDHHCAQCYDVTRRERELHGFRGHLAKAPPRVVYELEIVRRATPRVRIAVPLPVPVPRTNSVRIRKKWAKRAAGKTTWVYRTETIHIQISKSALWRLRKELAEREAFARHRK